MSTLIRNTILASLATATLGLVTSLHAGEDLLGYVQSAETLPQGSKELYQKLTSRSDKGTGSYQAWDYETEFEYGYSDKLSLSAAIGAMSLDTSGLIIDGYLPLEEDFAFKASGLEIAAKYNFLSPAMKSVGLSTVVSLDYSWLDTHSGQSKDTISAEFMLLAQKFFMEGQLVWLGNAGFETTYADRKPIDNLPDGFDWPTDPEMEIELKFGTGLSYRVVKGWYIGAEALYETEFETEVGQERWSWFAGPSIHYGSQKWWATLTYLGQLSGGGEQYEGQPDDGLHLIEKTKNEVRLKVAFNF